MGSIFSAGQRTLTDMNDVIASDTKPSNPIDGTLWWNTLELKLYIYYTAIGWKFAGDGMLIGGKNLLLKSGVDYNVSTYLVNTYTLSEDFVSGQEYTFVIKGTVTAGQKFGIWQNSGANNVGYATTTYVNGVTYCTFKAVAPTAGNERKLSLYNYPSSVTASTVDWVALYKGNIPMDWSPAPEDTQGQVDDINITLGNIANDALVDYKERQYTKDKLTEIIGYIISDSATVLPTASTLDAGTSGKGSFYYARKNATVAGIATNDAKYVALATAWENATTGLKPYLEGLTPIDVWDLRTATQSTNVTVVKDTWRAKWLAYYQAELDLDNYTAQKLKENADNISMGGTNYASNGNFEIALDKGLWKSNYTAQSIKEIVDISTESPPFRYAYHVKNTANANAGIFTPVLWSGVSSEAMVNKQITISYWIKYSGIVQGASGSNLGRFGELVIEGLTSGGAKVYSYPMIGTGNMSYVSGTNTTWQKVTATHTLSLPATAVKLSNISFKHGLEGCTGEFWTTGIKIEIGNRATDWSQSPFDIQQRMTDVEFKVLPDQIFASVSSTQSFNAILGAGTGDWMFERGAEMWKQSHDLTTDVTGATRVSGVAGSSGNYVLEVTGDKTIFYNRKIPVDTTRTYRVTFKVKQKTNPTTAGLSKVFAGVACYDASGNPLTYGTLLHRFNAIDNRVIVSADGWLTWSETISGESNDGYGYFIAGTKYVTPVCTVNNAGGNGVAQIAILKFEDITDVDSMATAINNLSVLMTPEGITTEIGKSTFYANLYGGTDPVTGETIAGTIPNLATNNDLKGYKSNDDFDEFKNNELGGLVGNKLKDLMDEEDSDLNVKYATNFALKQTSEQMTAKFSATGGMNLLRNSIGYGQYDFWNINGTDSNYIRYISNDELTSLGFGSGWDFKSGGTVDKVISQDVPVVKSKPYTMSWYINIDNNTAGDTGAFWIEIYEGQTLLKSVKYDGSYVTTGYENNFEKRPDKTDPTLMVAPYECGFIPTTDKITVKLRAGKDMIGTVTGLMLTIGDVALQWSLATGEAYNTNVRMDINGIRVSTMENASETDSTKVEVGYTQITPSEFAGYYRKMNVTTEKYEMERVFWLNADETVTKKLRALEEITMGSMKIIFVDNQGGNNGWAFVPIVS